MKTSKLLLIEGTAAAVLALAGIARAGNLAAAAAQASKLVNRPIAASPHALEEFPWLLRGPMLTIEAMGGTVEPAQITSTYPGNLVAAAALASALVNRPIAASPHALEAFPWLLRGPTPPTGSMGGTAEEKENTKTYPDNLAGAAAKASALVNRSILASPHALEEFPARSW